jgi:hypothetical protein
MAGHDTRQHVDDQCTHLSIAGKQHDPIISTQPSTGV